jgi:LysR family transcriptional regulator, nod-box dependent transcriptional activator
MQNLRMLDLNLLVALDALLEEGNVTRAARRLGLGQSATSSALKRLRAALGDELLVLSGRQMHLTVRSRELKPKIHSLLAQIETALTASAFDPSVSRRRFVIAGADYVTVTLLPRFLARVHAASPHMRFEMIELSSSTVEALGHGDIDAAILPRVDAVPENLFARSLFRERVVCIAAKKHPRIHGSLDLETFHAERRAAFQTGRSYIGVGEQQMRAIGDGNPPAVTCPSFLALLSVVGATDMVAIVQERLAMAFQKQAGLQVLEPPFATRSLDVSLLWAGIHNADPAHRWFREQLAETARGL